MKKKMMMSALVVLMGVSAVYAEFTELQKKQSYIRKFDVDADGKLNLAEFTELTRVEFEKKKLEGYQEIAQKRFKQKDENKDGFLTAEELIKSLVKLDQLPEDALGTTESAETE